MGNTPNPKRIMQNIVRMLVDSPDKVSVKAISSPNATVLQVSVASKEVGQIIGKQGRTARSLRTLLVSMGAAAKTRYSLDILANESNPTDNMRLSEWPKRI
jgi:uncharacterized protein